jgi:hypothetical protein
LAKEAIVSAVVESDIRELSTTELELVAGGIDKQDVGFALHSLVYGAPYTFTCMLIFGTEVGTLDPLPR